MTPASSSAEQDRIPLSVLTAYGAGGIIPIALFNVAGILVGLMGNISLGLSAFWLGVILVVPRVSDALADPIIGHLSDSMRSRWGRRRPFILLGGLLVAAFFVLMWWIPKGETVRTWFPSTADYQWFQLGYMLVSLTLFFVSVTVFEIPHGALGMEMTADPHQRTRLFSAKSFVGNLFAMSTPWLLVLANMEVFKGPRGNEADGMRYVSMLVAAVLVPLSFWWFFALKEPGFGIAARQKATPFWVNMKRTVHNVNFVALTLTIFALSMGFNFVQLLGSYIPIYYVFAGDKAAGAMLLGINGTVWAITGLLGVFPLNWLSPRLGKRNTLAVAILLITVAQLAKIVCYDPAHPYLMAIPTVPLSCGMLFFFTLGSSMVGDICDEDELHTGSRSEGAYYAVFWWFLKTGGALASLISGTLIALTLFDEGQVTKLDQVQGSVRDIRAMLETQRPGEAPQQSWPAFADAARTLLATSIEESEEYAIYLESERISATYEGEAGRERLALIAKALMAVKGVGAELAQCRLRVASLRPETPPALVGEMNRDITTLRMRAKAELTRVQAAELRTYLETRSKAPGKNRDHYQELANESEPIGARLERMREALPPEKLGAELVGIEVALAPLSKQGPYTLFTMRMLEIGLPLLACCLSLLFVFRYGLTESRSLEIKRLLARRHAGRNSDAPPILLEGQTP
jgi:GPH family glycoside/pentoside/hexuronide:cation symporter